MQSSEEQSYDTSSEQQRSETLRMKGMPISVGDEGGTRQGPPIINQFVGAQTARASQRPSFSFTETELSTGLGKDDELRREREDIKKTLTQSMTVAEAKKQRSAAIKKKIQEDYQKNRDPIKEFFKLVSTARLKLSRLLFCADLPVRENQQPTHELDRSHQF